MKISDIKAFPVSFPVPPQHSVQLGIGRCIKRDAVLVRVETSDGVVGWGEAHHGRCPGAIARFIDTTLRELVIGRDALDVVGCWRHVFDMQLASHGMGAAAAMGLSGLDMALWDVRCQTTNMPLYRLLGGSAKPIKAYAGGISLGWQAPRELVKEALHHVENGFKALKLRVGDSPARDIERVRAVRAEVGSSIELLVDANTAYRLDDLRRVMPAFEEMGVVWIEEPFPPMLRESYITAKSYGRTAMAAGENHYTRFEFLRLIEDKTVGYLQPDLSKTGGVTEALRIAALASTYGLSINPHTSATAINMATSIQFLCGIENAGYFEGDVTSYNPFRDDIADKHPYSLDAEGCVHPLDGAGIGLKVNTEFLAKYPLIDGPCYV